MTASDPFPELVERAITDAHITATPEQAQRFSDFLSMLTRWNRRIGLTAVDDPQQMVVRHILDSLSAEPFLQGPRVIDVGTGPGLPGIPLAIARPDLSFTLLDSLEKRMVFVRQAVFSLKLDNVTVVTSRVETYRENAKFDTLVTRAFASLDDIFGAAGALCDGRIVALKGRLAATEIETLEANVREVAQCHPVHVPGLDAERHIVVIPLDRS